MDIMGTRFTDFNIMIIFLSFRFARFLFLPLLAIYFIHVCLFFSPHPPRDGPFSLSTGSETQPDGTRPQSLSQGLLLSLFSLYRLGSGCEKTLGPIRSNIWPACNRIDQTLLCVVVVGVVPGQNGCGITRKKRKKKEKEKEKKDGFLPLDRP